MVLVWSVLFAGIYWLFKRQATNALVLGLAVLSHWFLDLIVHLPDLQLYPGGATRVGLQLWTNPLLGFVLETFIFVAGLIIYLKTTKAKNRKGVVVFWILVGLSVISHLANLFSPPPPSADAAACTGEAMWLFVVPGFWADRNREVRNTRKKVMADQHHAQAVS